MATDTEHSNIGYELVEQFATTNEIEVKVLKGTPKRIEYLVGGDGRRSERVQKAEKRLVQGPGEEPLWNC